MPGRAASGSAALRASGCADVARGLDGLMEAQRWANRKAKGGFRRLQSSRWPPSAQNIQ